MYHVPDDLHAAFRCLTTLIMKQLKAIVTEIQHFNLSEKTLAQWRLCTNMRCSQSALPSLTKSFVSPSAGGLYLNRRALYGRTYISLQDEVNVFFSNFFGDTAIVWLPFFLRPLAERDIERSLKGQGITSMSSKTSLKRLCRSILTVVLDKKNHVKREDVVMVKTALTTKHERGVSEDFRTRKRKTVLQKYFAFFSASL